MSKMTRCNVCGESEVDAYTELYGQGWTRCLRCALLFAPAVSLPPRPQRDTDTQIIQVHQAGPEARPDTDRIGSPSTEMLRRRLAERHPNLGQHPPQPATGNPDYSALRRRLEARHLERVQAAVEQAVGSPAEPAPTELREQLARVIVGQEYPGEPRKWEMLAGSPQLAHYLRMADALLAGPLASLLAAESDLNDELAQNVSLQEWVRVAVIANQQLVGENNKLLAQVARYEAAMANTPENIEVAKKVFWRHNGPGSCVAAVLAHIRRQAEMPAAQPEQAVIPDIGDSYEAALRVWAASNS